MNEKDLLMHLINLYNFYGVDESILNEISLDNIAKGVKGYLAILDKKKNKEYCNEDSLLIKDIYYLFC